MNTHKITIFCIASALTGAGVLASSSKSAPSSGYSVPVASSLTVQPVQSEALLSYRTLTNSIDLKAFWESVAQYVRSAPPGPNEDGNMCVHRTQVARDIVKLTSQSLDAFLEQFSAFPNPQPIDLPDVDRLVLKIDLDSLEVHFSKGASNALPHRPMGLNTVVRYAIHPVSQRPTKILPPKSQKFTVKEFDPEQDKMPVNGWIGLGEALLDNEGQIHFKVAEQDALNDTVLLGAKVGSELWFWYELFQ